MTTDRRYFAKIDVGYFDNPKIAEVLDDHPRVAILHLRAILYCKQHETNGVFPVRLVCRLAGAEQCSEHCSGHNAEQCSSCIAHELGLFERVDDRRSVVHDYLKHQDSAEVAKQRKDKAKLAADARWNAPGNAPSNASSNAQSIASSNAEERRGEERRDRGTAARKRATRIPDDFAVTDEMRTFVAEKGWTHLDLEAITEEFVDYWTGVPASKGTKLDWLSTWRNWIRRKAEDAPKVRHLRPAAGEAPGTSLWDKRYQEPTDD